VPARKTPPTLRRHKPSKQGVVTLNGRDFYLGHWSDGQKQPPLDVRTAYDALIAEWLVNGRRLTTGTPPAISVSELIRAFWDGHATLHYRHPDGTPTSELDDYRLSLRPLRELFGRLPRPNSRHSNSKRSASK
jgi:hypothetical protein